MTDETSGKDEAEAREKARLRDRLAIVYSLSRYYLFVPFAVLCTAVAPLRHDAGVFWSMLPFLLLVAAMAGGNWLREKYQSRDPNDDLSVWATRYTIMSGMTGAIWGIGAVIWFDFSSLASEAYLVLAFLGLSATEFIPRAAYRTAYLAHAIESLVPLALLLAIQGGVYQSLSAILVLYFAGVLYSYGATLGELLDESILLRRDHDALIKCLSNEKRLAETTRDTAQEKERAKSVFISNISHELRTPLTAILGMAQLLERSDLAKAQRDHVKVLLEAGRGLKTLLDDIIALAGDEGDSAAPEEHCDVAQAARTVARLLQPNAWEKRLRLSVNVAPGLPRVVADARLIRRVLLKLIGNAIKFTDRGNVEIALDASDAPTGQKLVRFKITDTGPGIPTHLLAGIFEPFAKPDTYSRRGRGVGVGLAVAKRLIESIDGIIGVESQPGMGASFWVTIPAALDLPADAGAKAGVAPPSGLSVLAFVPDSGMRDVLTQWLSPSGNRLTFVDSLSQAVTVSARGNFAAIIAPARSVDVLAAAPGQRMPILALLNGDDRLPDGADQVLRWPSTADALYAAVHAVTGHAEKPEGHKKAAEASIDSLIDAKAMAELEKSLGFKTLIDILQSYLVTAERLATELALAAERGDWMLTGRIAQDFAGAAGGLGLTAITMAARSLSVGARDGEEVEMLNSAAAVVLSEHGRVRDALRRLYPDLSA